MCFTRVADIDFGRFTSHRVLDFQSTTTIWRTYEFSDEQAIAYFRLFFDPLDLNCLDGNIFFHNSKTNLIDRVLFSRGFYLWSKTYDCCRHEQNPQFIVRMGILAYVGLSCESEKADSAVRSLVSDQLLLRDWEKFMSMTHEEKEITRDGVIIMSTKLPPT